MTATGRLGEFVASLDADAIDAALVAKAKDHLLDTLGVAYAGLADADARALATVVQRWGGVPEATVIGYATRLPAPKAAFVNALHARIHTFDDTHEGGPVHPGCAVVAAALAAAETSRAPGRALLASLVAGYEVAARMSAALGASHFHAGFHATGTATPLGAGAAAARACAFDAARATATLALAAGAAIGLRQYQQDGSMLDSAQNGARGAETGVTASAFAAAGASGARGILDGRAGLFRAMQGHDASILTADLGTRWHFSDVTIKPYASCRFTHGPVGALLAAGLDAREVAAVEIAACKASVELSDRPRPRDRTEAILSHQLAAALAILRRPILPPTLTMPDPPVRALADRVRVRHDPALDAAYPERWTHRVTVTMRGGERVELQSEHPPAADGAQIRAKFMALATPVLGAPGAHAIAAAIDKLESLPDIEPLLRPLRQDWRAAA